MTLGSHHTSLNLFPYACWTETAFSFFSSLPPSFSWYFLEGRADVRHCPSFLYTARGSLSETPVLQPVSLPLFQEQEQGGGVLCLSFGSSLPVISSSLMSPVGVGGSGREYPPLLASGSVAVIQGWLHGFLTKFLGKFCGTCLMGPQKFGLGLRSVLRGDIDGADLRTSK